MADYSCLLSTINLADAATLSGGSWNAAAPRSNLQTRDMSQVARTTNDLAASTTFTAAWTADQSVKVVAFYNHNLTLAATVRLQFKNAAGVDQLDVTVDAWANAFAGPRKPTMAEVAHYPAHHFVYILPTELTNIRSVVVSIADTSNPDEYVEIGRAWIGSGWQPVINMIYGAGLGWEHGDAGLRADMGAYWPGTAYKLRSCRFTLAHLEPDESMQQAFDIDGRLGVSGELLFILDPTTTLNLKRWSFPARFRQLSPVEFVSYSHNSKGYELEEQIPGSA